MHNNPTNTAQTWVLAAMRPLLAPLLVLAVTACDHQPQTLTTPDGTAVEGLGKAAENYVSLLQMHESGQHAELQRRLSKEIEQRRDKRDYEGCVHAAGDLHTTSLRAGDLAAAHQALSTFSECYARLPSGKVEDVEVATVKVQYRSYWTAHPGDPVGQSPTINCNSGHCSVRQISDYFSWSRPLEDFELKGVTGQGKAFAVIGAAFSTPFIVQPVRGYPKAKAVFRGTQRYERPSEPEAHLKGLVADIVKGLVEQPFGAEAKTLHRGAVESLAKVSGANPEIQRYRLRASLAYGDLDKVVGIIDPKGEDGGNRKLTVSETLHAVDMTAEQRRAYAQELLDKERLHAADIEALDYFDLVEELVPAERKAEAVALVEPYFYAEVLRTLTDDAIEDYLARFADGEHAEEVAVLQGAMARFDEAAVGGPAAMMAFWHEYRKTIVAKRAKAFMDDYIAEHVEVLESDIFAAEGDRDWLDDAVERMRPDGVYGGEKANVFIAGVYVNRGEVELPVRLSCDYHLALTVRVRALIVQSTETENVDKRREFVAYLRPNEPKVFLCMLKNQQSGGGVSAGILGGMDATFGFRDPAYSLTADFPTTEIPAGVLHDQEQILEAVRTSGNIETKASPWDKELIEQVGAGGTMVHYHFVDPGRKSVPFEVHDAGSGDRVYRDRVELNISAFRSPLDHGRYVLSLPKHAISCGFTVEGDAVHVMVDVKDRTCVVK